MKKFYSCIILTVLFATAFAQKGVLVPLQYHPKMNSATHSEFELKKSSHRAAALTLPFFDDFYQAESYPNPLLWQDDYVYINQTYPRKTITLGVATFDGSDSVGKPYSVVLNAAGPADMLTSQPIDLSGLTADSSVYLSFFYLAGDYGESPTFPNDSFTVHFLDTTGNWNLVWIASVDTVSDMRQIFIKVDSNYLGPNFQFRFQSYGNLNGGNDTWHIDYVKLDKNRDTSTEKNLKEVAYEFPAPSLLRTYYVMPYSQFDTTDQKDTVSVVVRNSFINPTTDVTDSYDANVVNPPTPVASFTNSTRDVGPLTENLFYYPKFNIPLGLTGDTIVVKVDYSFVTSAEASEPQKVRDNNSMTHYQVFSNFFAYDDGSSERGYMVEQLSNYKMAVKYGMRHPDTLQAIKMQLFPAKTDIGLATFSVCVWKNFSRNTFYNASDLIYQQDGMKVSDLIRETGRDTINGYYYAPIKQQFVKSGFSFPLVLSDTFAIGLIVQDPESLTVGFDKNDNASQYNLYVDGITKWRESDLPGTLVINPVVGKALPGYLTPVKDIKPKNYEVKIYPNPANDLLHVEGLQDKNLVQVFSINGSLLMQQEMQESGILSISNLPAATYVIRITNLQTKQTGISKFIKGE